MSSYQFSRSLTSIPLQSSQSLPRILDLGVDRISVLPEEDALLHISLYYKKMAFLIYKNEEPILIRILLMIILDMNHTN